MPFSKGNIPWNKKKKGIYSQEYLKKLKESHLNPSIELRNRISKTLKEKGIKPPLQLGYKWTDKQKTKIKRIHRSLETEFKEGVEPFNKGKRFPQISGEKSHFWRGGITEINQVIRQSLEYKLWREAVFARDNYTCIECTEKNVVLNADHIKPFALYPELRFAIDNGRTLCEDCHRKTDTYGAKLNRKILLAKVK